MLAVKSKKQRCVIFHGISGSGKSSIAEFMKNIFESHFKNETKGIFDELISNNEAHK